MTKLKLYGPRFSYFLRATQLMCEIKELSYGITLAPFETEIMPFSDAHASLHPFKKIPVLIDGDTILAETLAIAFYLDGKAGPSLVDTGSTHETSHIIAMANMITLYVHEALMRNLTLEFAFPKGDNKTIRFDHIEAHLNEAHLCLQWLTDTISSPHCFYGQQFTVCDAFLIPMLDYLSQLPEPFNIIEAYPSLITYLQYHQEQGYTKNVLGPPQITKT